MRRRNLRRHPATPPKMRRREVRHAARLQRRDDIDDLRAQAMLRRNTG